MNEGNFKMNFSMSENEMVHSLINSQFEDDNTFSRIGKGYAIIGILTEDCSEVELKVINVQTFYKEIMPNNIKLLAISSLVPYISIEE